MSTPVISRKATRNAKFRVGPPTMTRAPMSKYKFLIACIVIVLGVIASLINEHHTEYISLVSATVGYVFGHDIKKNHEKE
jgi:hypothetical protein